MSRRKHKDRRIYFKPRKFNKGGVLDTSDSTYKRGDLIRERSQAWYKYQFIGPTEFQHPNIFCDVNYSTVSYPFSDITLDPGDAGITDNTSFTINADGDLIVNHPDEAKFFIDYDNAILNYRN